MTWFHRKIKPGGTCFVVSARAFDRAFEGKYTSFWGDVKRLPRFLMEAPGWILFGCYV